MINTSSLESLKARLDIVDIISSFLELKKAGSNFKAPCPFHDEATASFVVSPGKQICHCFGCGVTHDAIGFVQAYKQLSFAEAVEEIANDMNFSLEYDNNTDKKDYSKLMEHTNSYYQGQLTAGHRDYLHSRGVTDQSIKAFEIGYAPASEQQLEELSINHFTLSDAADVGIIATTDGRTYARLTKRISFPIRNHTKKLIGFGGRIVEGDRAKYINSPQTALFDKSRQLYGYHLAKEHIHKKGTFTITEGYLDVVMFHQAGIKTAVATMGTALTETHCITIAKAKAKALLCFDGDRAGRAAAFKAAKLLSAHNIAGAVVLFPEGKDPADMIAEGQVEKLFAIMKKTIALIKYVINYIAQEHNLNIPHEKQSALAEIITFLKTLPPLIQDEYKSYTAKILSINSAHITIEQTSQPTFSQPAAHINIAEMSIIKTAADSKENRKIVLEQISKEMFDFQQREFDMLKHNDPQLQGVLLRDELRVYSIAELETQLKIIQIAHFSKKLQNIVHTNIAFERKAFEIKKIKGDIFRLRKELKNLQDNINIAS